jgi:hypothetical protein
MRAHPWRGPVKHRTQLQIVYRPQLSRHRVED